MHEAFGEGAGWSPVVTMEMLVNALMTMFDEQSDSFGLDDPLNLEAAAQCKQNKQAFTDKARQWTRDYARPVPIPEHCLARQ